MTQIENAVLIRTHDYPALHDMTAEIDPNTQFGTVAFMSIYGNSEIFQEVIKVFREGLHDEYTQRTDSS